MLNEHKVCFLARFGSPTVAKTILTNHLIATLVVLREGWVSNNAVKLFCVAVFYPMRCFQRISVFDVCIGNVVHNHIHFTNRPYTRRIILPVKCQIGSILTLLLYILFALNQHAARANGGVVYFVTFLRLNKTNHKLNNRSRGIKFATLFTSAIGKVLDHILVSCTKQIRENEIVICELVLVEMTDKVNKLSIADDLFAFHLFSKINRVKYSGQFSVAT